MWARVRDSDETADDASAPDAGAAFGQNDSEFNVFNTNRQLSALQTAAKMLAQLKEKKLLVYLASGLTLNRLNNQAQLQATIDDAIRANVSFWPIDSRGLVAQVPLGDATKGSPGNIGMYSGASMLAVASNFQQSQDTLYALAADTGGKAFLDSNDLARGIAEAQRSVSNYYILGYYTGNAAPTWQRSHTNSLLRMTRRIARPTRKLKLTFDEKPVTNGVFGKRWQEIVKDVNPELRVMLRQYPLRDLQLSEE